MTKKRIYDANLSAERIRTRRKQLGWTQSDLSKKSGLSLPTIKQYELGKRVPDGDSRIWLADALGVYERWIIGESDSMNFQTDINKLNFYIRDKKRAEFEARKEKWSDKDKENNEEITQMLRQLNKPMAVFEDIIELSGNSYEALERVLMSEKGLTQAEVRALSNAFFNKLISFTRAQYSMILENANSKAFFDKYLKEEVNDETI